MEIDATLQVEFEDDGWICPDTKTFDINNDPMTYRMGSGSNLVMVINECNTAVHFDQKYNLTTYTNATCDSSEKIKNHIEWLAINTKIMTKDYHDPALYYHN